MSEALNRKIRELEAQLALRDLENTDLRETVADLDGRNPNPEFRALRAELEATRAASLETDRAFLTEVQALEAGIEGLRFDLSAKEGELQATREALNANLARPVEPFEIRTNGHSVVALTHESREATLLAS